MFTTLHSANVYVLSTLCAIFFLSAQPQVALSQEEQPGDQLDASASTTVVAGSLHSSTNHPYKVETLTGDKVVGDFVVGPGRIELELRPGESKTIEMTIANRIGRTQEFEIEIEDATGSDNPDRPIVLLGEDRGPYSVRDYISIQQKTFTLEHNTRARITVTVTMPANAEPGGFYGSVLVKTVSVRADDSRGDDVTAPASAIISRIGTLFFVTVPGDVAKDGELKELSTIPKKKFFQSGPITFNILFENRGSIHLTPFGELHIMNTLGDEVGFVELQPWFALPDSLRFREVVWNREFLFGKYTAVIELNRGYDEIVDTMEYTFWVLPWKIIVAVFFAVFVVLFLFRLLFKNFEFKRKA